MCHKKVDLPQFLMGMVSVSRIFSGLASPFPDLLFRVLFSTALGASRVNREYILQVGPA